VPRVVFVAIDTKVHSGLRLHSVAYLEEIPGRPRQGAPSTQDITFSGRLGPHRRMRRKLMRAPAQLIGGISPALGFTLALALTIPVILLVAQPTIADRKAVDPHRPTRGRASKPCHSDVPTTAGNKSDAMTDDDIEELRRELLDAHDSRSPEVNPARPARRPSCERQRRQIAEQDELVGEAVRSIGLLAPPAR
jgi:hypothetical protein